jgi:hypothetical protein
MAAFWRGVQTNDIPTAGPAFFPERAYEQVKTLGDPKGDFVIRLLLDYRLDIGAVHKLLGPNPSSAMLVGVNVPESYAHWVEAGACYNQVGYWEVPNARVIYRVGGGTRSFGIASMISWRGRWYIIHLGATFRVGNVPVIDDASSGPGTSQPSSTC